MDALSPLVSICIPAYNSEKYIAETLQCLFGQSYTNVEIIVVDDGSADGTVDILKSITDTRFKYLKQQNKGAAAARNSAFKMSTGEFIKFMDADDLINPDGIKKQVTRIKDNPDCIASSKWGRFFGDDANTFTYTPEIVWKDMPGIDWVVDSLTGHGTNMTQPGIFLIPRNIIQKVGLWNESLSLIDDFEFMTKVIVNCTQLLFCEEAVLMYRSGMENSLSRRGSRKHMESALLSQTLGTKEILKVRDDAKSRKACANSLQVWAYIFYPVHLDLYKKIEQQIDRLGGADIKVKGSKMFVLLSSIFGWRVAKRFKLFLLSLLGKPDFNSFR